MSKIVVISLDKKFRNLGRGIKIVVFNIFRLTGQKKVYLEVYLVGKSFMDKNVLAFPAPRFFYRPDIKQKNLGEIYLNPDYIRKNGQNLNFMLIHGFLHLLGYHHKKKDDTIIMQKKESELFSKL